MTSTEIRPSQAPKKVNRWKRVLSGTTPWTPEEAAGFGQPLENSSPKQRHMAVRVLVGTTRGTLRGGVFGAKVVKNAVAHDWQTYRNRVRFAEGYAPEQGEVPKHKRWFRRTDPDLSIWASARKGAWTAGRPRQACITCGRLFDCASALRTHTEKHLLVDLPDPKANAWGHLANGGFSGSTPMPSWRQALRIHRRSRSMRREIGLIKGQRPKLVLVKGKSNPAAVPVDNSRGVIQMYDTWEHTPFTHALHMAAGHLREQPLKMTVINATARGVEWAGPQLSEAWSAFHLKAVQAGFDPADVQWMRTLAEMQQKMAQIASLGIARLMESYGPDIQQAIRQTRGQRPSVETLAS